MEWINLFSLLLISRLISRALLDAVSPLMESCPISERVSYG